MYFETERSLYSFGASQQTKIDLLLFHGAVAPIDNMIHRRRNANNNFSLLSVCRTFCEHTYTYVLHLRLCRHLPLTRHVHVYSSFALKSHQALSIGKISEFGVTSQKYLRKRTTYRISDNLRQWIMGYNVSG